MTLTSDHLPDLIRALRARMPRANWHESTPAAGYLSARLLVEDSEVCVRLPHPDHAECHADCDDWDMSVCGTIHRIRASTVEDYAAAVVARIARDARAMIRRAATLNDQAHGLLTRLETP